MPAGIAWLIVMFADEPVCFGVVISVLPSAITLNVTLPPEPCSSSTPTVALKFEQRPAEVHGDVADRVRAQALRERRALRA